MHHYNLYQQTNTLVLVLALDFRKVTIPKTSLSSFSDVCNWTRLKCGKEPANTGFYWALFRGPLLVLPASPTGHGLGERTDGTSGSPRSSVCHHWRCKFIFMRMLKKIRNVVFSGAWLLWQQSISERAFVSSNVYVALKMPPQAAQVQSLPQMTGQW